MAFANDQQELEFLRGLVQVHRLADEVIEDCLERQLGLAAGLDAFLAQCARLIHARAGFVRLRGTRGPVLTRIQGRLGAHVDDVEGQQGLRAVGERQTLFVTQLNLGRVNLGALGLQLEGQFPDSGGPVQAFVGAMGEALDSAVLSFLALSGGQSALQRLDELSPDALYRAQGRIGRYELLMPLGSGGMAQVMLARCTGPEDVGRLVAFKRVLPRLLDRPEVVKQFLDEAQIGLSLSHPNLITLYDFGEAAGAYYIAMELARGVDLENVLSFQTRLAPELAVGVAIQALRGIHHAHELKDAAGVPLQVVHRDLSPPNLVVGFDGRVKVLDFGIAKIRTARTMTLPGTVKGKPLYMSPEQVRGDRLDRRSDLWSIAVTLYELLSGTPPFEREDMAKTMEAIVVDAPAPSPHIPPDLWQVLQHALQKAPGARPRTALELASALEAAVAPASEAQLADFVAGRFPERRALFSSWER